MILLACRSKYECKPGAMLSNSLKDVCFDNGRCRDGNCLNLCEYHGKVPCLCEGDDIVSFNKAYLT